MSETTPSNFIRTIIDDDLRSGRVQQVVTRFPPEPNGYLHIGHAKAICTSFGMAEAYGGRYHLRFDDTNPLTEETEYVDAIQADIRWLGFDWGEHLFFASDYFGQLFDWAKHLVEQGKAYVDELSEDDIRAYRGTVEEAGRNSPWRDRPASESLDLLDRMNTGEFEDGAMVLRARIDMAHTNMKMRDPVMYRIRNAPHHRTGDAWHVYPLYDWAHGQSDAIEGITHSLCSLEFDVNRPLYEWYLEQLPSVPHGVPHQYEFARLNLTHTVMSKRRLIKLVTEGHVSGWDDPRMPTLAGLRRRGVPAPAIRAFIDRVGVAKANSVVDPSLLDHAIRDHLNHLAPRRMAILDPLEIELTTWPEGTSEQLVAQDWPHDVPKESEREVPFSGRLYIEREDFALEPPKGWHRLAPGVEVRLRYGYYIRCDEVVTDAAGDIVKLRCSHDPATRGGTSPDGRKVKGTLHWVSAAHAVPLETRLVDRLFAVETPGTDGDFLDDINPDGLKTVTAHAEPSLRTAEPGSWVQLERVGYFVVDPVDSTDGAPVLIRTTPLKDGWKKVSQPQVSRSQATQPQVVGEARALAPEHRIDADELVAIGLSEGQARVLATEPALRAYYDAALVVHPEPRVVASWVVNELRRASDGDLAAIRTDGAAIGQLAKLVDDGTITGSVGKDLLTDLVREGGDPAALVEARGLGTIEDGARITAWIDEAIAGAPERVEAYRAGRTGLLGYFIGQVMQASGRRADPQQVRTLLQERLDG